MKSTSWVTPGHKWYWARLQRTARSKPQVLLVETVEWEGRIFVKPWGDKNCYPRDFCQEWDARFIEAKAPPGVADFD